jgi:hypothetical protein
MKQTLLQIKRGTPVTTQEIAQQAQLPLSDVFVVETGGFTSQDKVSRVLAAFNHLSGMHLTRNDIVTQNATMQNHHQDSYFKRVVLRRM